KQLNRVFGQQMVKNAMRTLGFKRSILWFVVPHIGPIAGHLGEDYVVYYCIDDYSGLPDVDQREISSLDFDLTRRADQVFVASTTLLEKKRALNPTTEYSPHGVDFDHFHRASDRSLPVAEKARNLGHPVIGFFGSISGWIDVDLLVNLARTKPEWTLL